MARTYSQRGIVLYDARNVAGAESDLRNAIGLLQQLAGKPAQTAVTRTTPEPSQELARAYNNLANITRRDDPPRALELYQQAISLAEALNRKQPKNGGGLASLGRRHEQKKPCPQPRH